MGIKIVMLECCTKDEFAVILDNISKTGKLEILISVKRK